MSTGKIYMSYNLSIMNDLPTVPLPPTLPGGVSHRKQADSPTIWPWQM